MSQTVDRIISIFKAMSRVEKIELVTAIATDPDVKAEVEALSPKPTAAASSGGKDGSRRRLSRLGGSSLSRESATRMPVARS